ncbi:MAG: TetR-like C-terminal domain-containing protein [Pseudomonadota bacterium]
MRRQLIEVAREIVANGGLQALTARGLATRLGWAVGTIYTVLPTLDAITLEANAEELAELNAALRSDLAKAPDETPERRVMVLTESYLRFTLARPKSWAAIFERDAEGDPPDWYRARQTVLFDVLEEALRPLLSQYDDPDAEARQASRALWAALQGLSALAMAGHIGRVAETSAPELARYLVDTFLAGLAARR